MHSPMHVRSCACEKGKRWQAIALLQEMVLQLLTLGAVGQNAAVSAYVKYQQWEKVQQLITLNAVSWNASMSACEKGEKWEGGRGVLQEMMHQMLTADVVSWSACTSASEKGMQW